MTVLLPKLIPSFWMISIPSSSDAAWQVQIHDFLESVHGKIIKSSGNSVATSLNIENNGQHNGIRSHGTTIVHFHQRYSCGMAPHLYLMNGARRHPCWKHGQQMWRDKTLISVALRTKSLSHPWVSYVFVDGFPVFSERMKHVWV